MCWRCTKPDNVVPIVISEGDNLEDVAQNLKDHGLIRYKFLFKLCGMISHAEFSTGTFELNQQFDYHALVNGLAPAGRDPEDGDADLPGGLYLQPDLRYAGGKSGVRQGEAGGNSGELCL